MSGNSTIPMVPGYPTVQNQVGGGGYLNVQPGNPMGQVGGGAASLGTDLDEAQFTKDKWDSYAAADKVRQATTQQWIRISQLQGAAAAAVDPDTGKSQQQLAMEDLQKTVDAQTSDMTPGCRTLFDHRVAGTLRHFQEQVQLHTLQQDKVAKIQEFEGTIDSCNKAVQADPFGEMKDNQNLAWVHDMAMDAGQNIYQLPAGSPQLEAFVRKSVTPILKSVIAGASNIDQGPDVALGYFQKHKDLFDAHETNEIEAQVNHLAAQDRGNQAYKASVTDFLADHPDRPTGLPISTSDLRPYLEARGLDAKVQDFAEKRANDVYNQDTTRGGQQETTILNAVDAAFQSHKITSSTAGKYAMGLARDAGYPLVSEIGKKAEFNIMDWENRLKVKAETLSPEQQKVAIDKYNEAVGNIPSVLASKSISDYDYLRAAVPAPMWSQFSAHYTAIHNDPAYQREATISTQAAKTALVQKGVIDPGEVDSPKARQLADMVAGSAFTHLQEMRQGGTKVITDVERQQAVAYAMAQIKGTHWWNGTKRRYEADPLYGVPSEFQEAAKARYPNSTPELIRKIYENNPKTFEKLTPKAANEASSLTSPDTAQP